MPLRIESLEERGQRWVVQEVLKPGQSAAVEQHRPDGKLVHYHFKTSLDDAFTDVSSAEEGQVGIKPERTLNKGQDFVLTLRPGKEESRRIFRFSHT